MINNRIVATILSSIFAILMVSCVPDCREITFQIAEWQTRYEDYIVEKDSVVLVNEMVDTTVSYVVEKYYTKKKITTNSGGKEIGATGTHYVTIRNTNNSYSNRFAIKIEGKEYNESKGLWQNLSKSSNYVTINPNATYTFQISHSAWWRNSNNGYNEDEVTLHLLQSSNFVERTSKKIVHIRRKQKRRIDELVMKDTTVNNCDCDVDALKARNAAVAEVFETLKKQKLIQTK